MDDTTETIERVVATVLSYTARHPAASDTIDGITRWWLAHEECASPRVVRIALERLVASGRLHRTIGPDGSVRYSARGA